MKQQVKSHRSLVISKGPEWVTERREHDQHKTKSSFLFAPRNLNIDEKFSFSFSHRKPKKPSNQSSKYDSVRFKGKNVLDDAEEDTAGIIYRPKTQETKQIYESLLGFIQEAIGDEVCFFDMF